jgi:hypothetical protein
MRVYHNLPAQVCIPSHTPVCSGHPLQHFVSRLVILSILTRVGLLIVEVLDETVVQRRKKSTKNGSKPVNPVVSNK